MLQALTDKSQENVEGVARLRLYKGSARRRQKIAEKPV
jgi:argininosuccinate synthase